MHVPTDGAQDAGSVPPLRGWPGVDAAAPGAVRRQAFVLGVASGKGGTGKSFVVSNLAVLLAGAGVRVTVVDCDFGLGSAHLLLGVNPERTLQHYLAGKAGLDEVCVATPHGPRLLPGGSGVSALASLDEAQVLRVLNALARLAAECDVLLLDAPAGIAPQSLLLLLGCDLVTVVTNPEIAAMTDAYALVKCLWMRGGRCPMGVVLNRVASAEQGAESFARLAEVSRRFVGCPLHSLGHVPEDPGVRQRRLGQPPAVVGQPASEVACAIQGIRNRLVTLSGGLQPRPLTGASDPRERWLHWLRQEPPGEGATTA